MSTVDFEEVFTNVPSWTSLAEREELAHLAAEVPPGGTIVEIGGLYGGMTIVMGQANPEAWITVIDNFSWSPIQEKPASKSELNRNVLNFGVTKVKVEEGDSREIGKAWSAPIDLLWIDGGHSYEYVRADLENFAPHAQVVAVHDWDNPAWPDIRQAVEEFMRTHSGWEIASVVEMVVVLRRVN